jgi:hypothetical protein
MFKVLTVNSCAISTVLNKGYEPKITTGKSVKRDNKMR